MKCPFELPVKKVEKRPMFNPFIEDKDEGELCMCQDEAEADYIVQAINSHKKLVEALKNANVWLGGKIEEPSRPTVWLKKYTQRHNVCVGIIEQALKETEKL